MAAGIEHGDGQRCKIAVARFLQRNVNDRGGLGEVMTDMLAPMLLDGTEFITAYDLARLAQ